MIGRTLSHYKVLEKIGQGGMGEVYRAEDTSLKREVAIKVLPEQFTKDPQRLARFEREAQLLASLNHPNIAAIHSFEHSDDIHFLVLELVEGETLAERVAKGPLPVEEALEVCRQIAEGMEAAHEKGVIHRDLKPATVKVTPEGKVKILDFGLAKAFEDETPVTDISQSPTLTQSMTQAGVILGTAAYMSPEQARGKPVDKRTDVWAFGCVLYECLTGQQAFGGETITDILGALIHKEPDWEKLPENTPWRIKELLRRCLTKDAHDRLRDIANVRVEIKLALTEPAAAPIGVTSPAQPPLWRRAIPWSVGLLMGLIALGIAFWSSPQPVSRPLNKFVMIPPSTAPLVDLPGLDLLISPDGRRIAYMTESDDTRQLYMRPLNGLMATPIPGTEGMRWTPFFSPDSESIVIVVDGKLKKISLVGEPPITLCEAPAVYGGTWGPEDTIVFAGRTESGQGLHLVSAAGGEPEILIITDFEKGEIQYRRPEFLPGGKAVLFSIRGENGFQLAALSLATREKKIVLEGAREAHYSPTGHLVYVVPETGTLSAVLFDHERLEVIGEPVPVLEGIREDPDASVDYSFSSEGTLIYVPAGAAVKGVPVWVDREGREMESLVEEPLQNPQGPRLSPDGRRLVVAVNPGDGLDLWVYDLAGRPPYPLTAEGRNSYPLWSPDGKRVVFRSVGGGSRRLLQVAADGTTLNPELLLSSTRNGYPTSWSADGQELIFLDASPGGSSLMSLPIEGQQEPRLLVQTQYAFRPGQHGASAALSPDGRWLAYVSGVTGGPEIWVRPYPGPGAPLRLSPSGGLEVVWGPEGRELFYLEGDKMMAVKIETEPRFRFQPPELLFEGDYYHANPSYDIGPDGRFLMIKLTEEPRSQINVVLNWFEELKRLVPVN